MPRSSEQWRAYVEALVTRVKPAFEQAGLPASAGLRVELGGAFLLTFEAAREALVLGLPEDPAQLEPARQLWADLLATADDAELERALELLFVRLGLHMFSRHIRLHHGAATNDEWIETQVADAIAYAASARLIDPHAPFLDLILPRAIQRLQERRLLGFQLPGAEDPA